MRVFLKNLAQAAGWHFAVVLLVPIALFCGVEIWRAVTWLLEAGTGGPVSEHAWVSFSGIVYGLLAFVYFLETVRSHRNALVLYLVLGVLYVVSGTASVYGLFAVLEGMVPSLARIGVVNATAISMSVLLGSYMLSHWRTNR